MSRTLFAVVWLAAGCSPTDQPPAPDPIPQPREVARAVPDGPFARGVAYLLKQQSPDGAWRSDVYATFKDGTALTPLVLCALLDAADAGHDPAGSAKARKKAVAWLAKFAKPDGTIDPGPDGFEYPVYTAALATIALSHQENADHRKARDAWVTFLKERQLTEKLGWHTMDKQYGGWGYCRVLPRKPEPDKFAPPLIESNLSATLFALEALKAANALGADTAKAATVFVRNCQNYAGFDGPGDVGPSDADGGFHFIYDDPVRNKAGMIAGPPGGPPPAPRFHSYGSTTADGFRALALCGLADGDTRRDVAHDWLLKHFRADTHPGTYAKTLEPNREAVFYYYAASVAKAFHDHNLKLPDGRDWAAELAAELKKRQRDDGSWSNPVELVRENEPLVATANAVTALAKCKK